MEKWYVAAKREDAQEFLWYNVMSLREKQSAVKQNVECESTNT
jgi:hypothetical protein